MNEKNSLEPSEPSGPAESHSDNNISERHWIFKRNKDFVQGKCLQKSTEDSNRSETTYKDDHKRFLQHLLQLQQSLTSVDPKKCVVVDQVIPDSATVNNLFVNSASCHKRNFNLKVLEASVAKIKEEDSITDANGTSTITRSTRPRRCKANKSTDTIFNFDDDDSDDDFVIEKIIFPKQEETTKKRKIYKQMKNKLFKENGAVSTVSTSPPKPSTTTSPDKNVEVPDELLGDVDLESTKKKKRKIDILGSNVINNMQNTAKHFMSKYPLSRLTNKMSINGDNKGKDNNVIIEIADGENESIEKETKMEEEKVKKITKHSCPMCNKMFSTEDINDHAYNCQGPTPARTRTQLMKEGSQEITSVSYDEAAWKSACKGLDKRVGEISPIKKEDVFQKNAESKSDRNASVDNGTKTTVSRDSELNNPTRNQNLTNRNATNGNVTNRNTANQNSTNQIASNQNASNQNPTNRNAANQNPTNGNATNQNVANQNMKSIFGSKDPFTNYKIPKKGSVPSNNLASLDNSTRDIIEDYAKTLNRISKKPPAKNLRTFGDKSSGENEGMKCARCEQYFSEEQYQIHTISCLEKSFAFTY